jgi:protein ImuB
MLPALQSAPSEPEREQVALRRLALWAERFSPSVAVDELQPAMQGLLLDMTGGAHLFGGEGALLQEIERRLEAAAIPARAALADTPGAAWALARFGAEKIAAAGRTREAIAELPVEALRLGEPALKLLRRFGLRRIGELYPLPRAGLARRFGAEEGMELVRRLDQAGGGEAEPLEPVRPAPLYRAWTCFAEPLIDIEGVAHVLPQLAQALAAQLERDGKGARRLVLTAFRVDGRTTGIEAGLSLPAAAPAHLLRLLKERGLERLDLGFGVDALMLSAHKAEPARVRQTDIAPDAARAGEEALAALIDRIEARLGEGAVRRPVLLESHIPERSEAWVADPPPGDGGGGSPQELEGGQPRPLLLLDPPEPIETLADLPDSPPARFTWRRVAHKVARADGPERLSPEWWKPGGAAARAERTRDYYRVEDEHGRRFWLFREGLYAREDGPPSWWMHGVFA